ncbi:MAG: M28 family peptidase [Acidobacteria bacterium]|nr:M28 family peptidase [Acidobacteriota bacterium]
MGHSRLGYFSAVGLALGAWLVFPGLLAPQTAPPLNEQYKDAASRIIAAALSDQDGYAKLTYLCERIGNRLSGSTGLEKAIEWASAQMKKDGLDNVVTPPAKVPHWVRGKESAKIVAPVERPLKMLGLGGSVGTPPEGITAEVVSVSGFDELERLGKEKVAGKIVVYNVPWEGYGRTVQYRGSGASRAAALGAVAMLMRSAGPPPLEMPHTGGLRYSDDAPRIPAAALALEDVAAIQKLVDSGEKVKIHLSMEAQTLPDADSANVIGEIRGREKPEEIVVIGGHLDSWDVGQGAHDDGGGAMASWQALEVIVRGLRPDHAGRGGRSSARPRPGPGEANRTAA